MMPWLKNTKRKRVRDVGKEGKTNALKKPPPEEKFQELAELPPRTQPSLSHTISHSLLKGQGSHVRFHRQILCMSADTKLQDSPIWTLLLQMTK